MFLHRILSTYILDAGQHNVDGFPHVQDRSLPAAQSLCLLEPGEGLETALEQFFWIPVILLQVYPRSEVTLSVTAQVNLN